MPTLDHHEKMVLIIYTPLSSNKVENGELENAERKEKAKNRGRFSVNRMRSPVQLDDPD
jgi:hypothetical protein